MKSHVIMFYHKKVSKKDVNKHNNVNLMREIYILVKYSHAQYEQYDFHTQSVVLHADILHA
jgi:hypothetical protein